MNARTSLEASSGKGAGDENFPVGSLLISPRLRPCVAAFYDFARAADDIADAPDLTSDEKLRRLSAFEALLDDPDGVSDASNTDTSDKPGRLRRELAALHLDQTHARTLLIAFKQDAVKARYQTFDELVMYCRHSADPVGRFLLDLHGEERSLWPASDTLCTVLQILNHLQDFGKDLKQIDRVYLPTEWMAEYGVREADLGAAETSPGLRCVIDRCLDECEELLKRARELAPHLRDRRLAAETATIFWLARRLANRLRAQDPLAERVKLTKLDFARAAFAGLQRLLQPWPARPLPQDQRLSSRTSG